MLAMFPILVLCLFSLTAAEPDNDGDRSFAQLLYSRKILYESHSVTTPDGYILTIQRAPGTFTDPPSYSKPAVLLIHGLMDRADTWIYNDEKNALGTLLPKQGYDVWYANNRGVQWSQGHVTEDEHFYNQKYWNFTFDEMAQYDLPVMIDLVLKVSRQKQLIVIGHSQGAAQTFAALSDPQIAPSIQDKISLFVALSPAIRLYNVDSVFWNTCAHHDCENLFSFFHVYSIGDLPATIVKMCSPICNVVKLLCEGFAEIIADEDPTVTNWDQVQYILPHEPGATSIKNIAHWAQLIKRKLFAKFDYGQYGNLQKYGTPEPPVYDYTKVKVPIGIFTGAKDAIVNVENVRVIKSELEALDPSPLKFYKEIARDGHLSILWGEDNYLTYFPDLLDLLKKYV